MDILREIPEYLRIFLAMSIRDASFIISFENIADLKMKKIQICGSTFFYRVDLVDLDIKPLKKFSYYLNEIKVYG